MIDSHQTDELAQKFGVQLRHAELPVAEFPDWAALADILGQIAAQRFPQRPVIAISGSQGSGKSTLARTVAAHMTNLEVVSLDDFYLTKAARQRLGSTIHPLLVTRGVPGTHDHGWLGDTLAAVKQGGDLTVPIFDKASDDRAGARRICSQGLLVEGWCLGVQPEKREALATPCNELERLEDADGHWRGWVNEQLKAHYQPLWQLVDFWIHLSVPGFDQILKWRSEQEQALPPAKRMSQPELSRFIQHYERLTRQLWRQPPLGPGLRVELNEDHKIADVVAIPFR